VAHVERVLLVHRSGDRLVDGIRDHGDRLDEELAERGIAVRQTGTTGERTNRAGWRSLWQDIQAENERSTVFVQYSPFCYGRWGFAPWLPLMLLIARRRARRPSIALMVHEDYVPMSSWRWTLMSLWQRAQLRALKATADIVFVSIEAWAERLRLQHPRRPVRHLPVGSNFPDARGNRENARKRMGVDHDSLVLATLARDHPSWVADYVSAAVEEAAGTGRRVHLLMLGAEAPPLQDITRDVVLHAPGYLDDGDFAAAVASADIFLAPLIDGISTRRGALMVALQHGLPVVATIGPSTDALLRRSTDAVHAVPVGDFEGFARKAGDLARDPALRASAGAAARSLYERNFDWPVLVDSMLEAIPTR
jgi:glycosyltransferase involved in cell wall biosynthesis